ncbi:MAG: hypothetical protein R3258_08945 [Acidimicrobiia bacterium]|nr:hypothetical protein [Acidimicrobiia bacterium]
MTELRRLPLKIAGVIGIFSAAFHLAVLLGIGGASESGLVVGLILLMFLAGVLAWVAPESSTHGRRIAMVAAGLFFLVGLPTESVFLYVFLVALVLSILGFAGVEKQEINE